MPDHIEMACYGRCSLPAILALGTPSGRPPSVQRAPGPDRSSRRGRPGRRPGRIPTLPAKLPEIEVRQSDRAQHFGILVSLQPVRPDDLEFGPDHPVHRDLRHPLGGRHETDLDMPCPACANRRSMRRRSRGCRRSRGRYARRLPVSVRISAAVSATTAASTVAASAEPTGERSGIRREVHRDHLRARRDREHHRRDPGAAAAVHGDPLTRPHVSLPQQCAERGGEPAAERRRRAPSSDPAAGQPDSSRHSRPRRIPRMIPNASRPAGTGGRRSVDCSLAHSAHDPQAHTNGTVTRSPTCHPLTNTPSAAMRPASSCPATCGSATPGSWPCQLCQSLRQTPVASTSITTPSGAGSGSGASAPPAGPRTR